ncbi:MAG TPA: O-antigen ligase family protein [Solirubrobacterales bacterium]|nr:O-antigen ligase family protein [Solirubrobacterales bacterium]
MIESLVALVAACAVAVALLDKPSMRRSVAMAIAAVLVPVLIAGDQWHSGPITELRNSPGILTLVIAFGLALVGFITWVINRWPVMLPVLVLVALPFRIPLEVGGEDANLLLPLYLVMAGGVLASLIRARRGQFLPTEQSAWPRGLARLLKPLLAVAVLLYALGLFYSDDRSTGLQNLCFFLVPFALIFALMTEVEWSRERLRILLTVIVGLALACAFVGFIEFATRDLLWNQVVIRSNDFHVYFRVNSLFWDPNIYGRYLALAITMVAAGLMWARSGRDAVWLALVSLVLWLALMTTYSQSSFIALLAGLATLVALRWSLKWLMAGVGALVVAVILFGTFAGGLVKLDLGAINKQTSGRANLVEGGIDLFEARPVYGFGPGSFSVSFKEEVAGPNAPVTESHTEPITVAAEQGLIGLAVYLALILSIFAALTAGMRKVMPGLGASRGSRDPDRGPPAARAAVFAAFVAVLVHTLTYAGFLDDPVTWVLIAIGYSLAFPCRATSAA